MDWMEKEEYIRRESEKNGVHKAVKTEIRNFRDFGISDDKILPVLMKSHGLSEEEVRAMMSAVQ